MSLERYIGALMGCAVGDSLGMCVEGWRPEQIRKHVSRITGPMDPVLVRDSSGELVREDEFGKLTYLNHEQGGHKGDVTDATILTIALAEAIINAEGISLHLVAKYMVSAIDTRQKGAGFKGGFDNTTMAAYQRLKKRMNYETSGTQGASGNGPVVKIAPIGLFLDVERRQKEALYHTKTIPETLAELFAHPSKYPYMSEMWCGQASAGTYHSTQVCRMTHKGPEPVAAAKLQTRLVYDLVNSKLPSLSELAKLSNIYEVDDTRVYNPSMDINEPHPEKILPGKSTSEKIKWIGENPGAAGEEAYKAIGNGAAVYESYPFALFMFQKYLDKPLEGLLEAVNWGGDSSSTGAIYGTLMGAYRGSFWPAEWEPKEAEKIKSLAEGLYTMKAK